MLNFFNIKRDSDNTFPIANKETEKADIEKTIKTNELEDRDWSSFNHFVELQNARNDLIGEIQAVIDYDNKIHNSNNKSAVETWKHIKNEELTHIGELMALINHLSPSTRKYVEKGINEFNERLKDR